MRLKMYYEFLNLYLRETVRVVGQWLFLLFSVSFIFYYCIRGLS